MKLYFPQYYEQFRCIAAACPDSCCKDWAVDVDAQAAAFYRALPGPLGDRLRAVLVPGEDGSAGMQIENGRCPMWRQDGLCRIQAELGHEALCHTCRTFPRLQHDFGTFAELGLELSCPEAARLILTGPADFLCRQLPGGDAADYEEETMAILLHSRQIALEFLSAGHYTVPEKLAILLLYAHSVQAQLDGGEEALLQSEEDLAEARRYAGRGDLNALFGFFQNLEILTDTWKNRLESPISPAPWTDQHIALCRYFLSRYWLQAVSDYDLIGRVKFAIIGCILIRALGGDMIATAQAFSKEIENDPDNVEAILDGAYTSPALTDTQLLSLLLA